MDVYEAVRTRRSVRNFTNRPVPREALERVLAAAAWAPSGSNIQPWHTYVVTGASLVEIRKLAGERVAAGDKWDEREYEMYPGALKSPYREHKAAFVKDIAAQHLLVAFRIQLDRQGVTQRGHGAPGSIRGPPGEIKLRPMCS